MNDFKSKIFKYLLLLTLLICVAILFGYKSNLEKEKASLIKLASFYPDDRGFGHYERIFSAYAAPKYGLGFFQYQEPYLELANAIKDLQEAEDNLNSFLPQKFDSVVWTATPSSTIDLYNTRVLIPSKDLVCLRNSLAKYVEAFKVVLKRNHWRASIDIPEVRHEDSIHVDVSAVEIELEQFQKNFIREDFEVNNTEFDLSSPTFFELFFVLEQIKRHHQKIEREYARIIRSRMSQWKEVLHDKMMAMR